MQWRRRRRRRRKNQMDPKMVAAGESEREMGQRPGSSRKMRPRKKE
jgi:hypothetical protein